MVFSLPEVLFSRIWVFSSRGVSCSRWCFQFPPPGVCGSRNGVFSYLVGVLGSHIGVCSSCGCFWFPGSAGGLDRVAVAAASVFWVPAGVFGSHTGLNKGGAASGVAGAGARDVDQQQQQQQDKDHHHRCQRCICHQLFFRFKTKTTKDHHHRCPRCIWGGGAAPSPPEEWH